MLCPNCRMENISRARYCAHCGQPLTRSAPKGRGWMMSTIILVLMLIGGAYLYFDQQASQSDITVVEPANESVVEPPQEEEALPEAEAEAHEEPEAVAEPEETADDRTEIIREAQSKVFTILTSESQGSGFLYEDNGTVVTNAHVVAGYRDVTVKDTEGNTRNGQVIGISDQYDVALIQVDDLSGQAPLEVEDEQSAIGTEVIALGSPQGLENTASIGYLTGLDRSFEAGFIYEDVYQIDAQISPGSSGGPLLDADTGKVIGINSALLTADESIGFSIPMYTMTDLLKTWTDAPMTENEVVNVFSYSDEYVYDEEVDEKAPEMDQPAEKEQILLDEESLVYFILAFRDSYEVALTYEDFSMIEPMLLDESDAYWELSDYIDEISGLGLFFDFISNDVTSVDIQEDYAVVSTYEVFDFMNAAGEWSVYERVKDYVVVADEYGYYQIAYIEIYE
ncbi:trypsin-like serine protease [Halobacillus fulvus]|nr:trypsin-like serine protease [Halobacillus fulvus]